MNNRIINTALLCLLTSFSSITAFAEDHDRIIQSTLDALIEESSLSSDDVSDWVITDQYTSEHNQVTHIYIRQRHNGIDVFNAVANFNIKNSEVLSMNQSFIPDLASRINTTSANISPAKAIQHAMQQLNIEGEFAGRLLEQKDQEFFLFEKEEISLENIPVVPMYQPMPEGEVRLAWDLSIYMKDAHNWWSIRVDAQSGAILHKNNWVVDCSFGHANHSVSEHNHVQYSPALAGGASGGASLAPDAYNVFPLPVESPIHGSRSLVVNPADSVASPFGWHDTNGVAGAEYTITRGNNVLASEDRDADNLPGYSPDGGATLDFDFPLNTNQQPIGYEDAAITNLFFMNNMMHDVWYQYGFTEVSGNFQANNYGNGGLGSDYVFADAQDGAGFNNANFGTPPDGSNPRMQMFLWGAGGGLTDYLQINTPAGIAGAYGATGASFGPGIPTTPITANLVIVEDSGGINSNDACEPIINGTNINGKIAVIDRGDCSFVLKVEAAQNEGAVAVIIVNNVSTPPITMGGSSASITIPSIMISQADGDSIKAAITGGATVNGTIQDSTTNFDLDGDFDNGIIAHEYGHGISNRLTGGPTNVSCLDNAEQMGEGWSDFFGIVMTIKPGDTATDVRGVGTFVLKEPITGNGIRPAPYTTDTTINPFTYAATNNTSSISQPHGIGFVWCTMLWDLTWAFIDIYGYDPDLSYGSGGNNMVMQLVMDGMKLQPCSPGFVDGRDAILAADQVLYGGAHQCLIWEVFANRGLGFSASQGSTSSRTDQVEAFDLPTICQIAEFPPIAAFTPDSLITCYTTIDFEDQSTDIPQQWFWDFGDGDTSDVQNPSHTYSGAGVFTVTLIVSNTLGSDTTTAIITITAPEQPVAMGGDGCFNDSVQLSASGSGEIRWFDGNGNQLGVGDTFWTSPLDSSTLFFAQNADTFPVNKIGPVDNTIGTGGYHGTTFIGTINFTAHQPLVILSAWVDAAYAGSRDFFLWSGTSASGSVLQQITIDIPFAGAGRVDLGFEIPSAGNYSIGSSGVDMYRNNAGALYPYEIPGLMSITSSSAVSGPAYYYYLYDLEVAQAPCLSPQVPVLASVDSSQCEPFAYSTMVAATSVRLNWLGQAECNYRYQLRGRAINSSNWTVIEIAAGSPDFLDVPNLPTNVTYEWQIRAYCSSLDPNQLSPWSNLDVFFTACLSSDSIWTDSITTTTVQLRWSEVDGAFGYEINGGVVGSSSIVSLIIPGQVTTYNVTGLSPNTAYRWAVRTFCSASGSLVSGFSEIDTFATPAPKNLIHQFSQSTNSMEVMVSPNPFADETELRIYQISEVERCMVEVFDATGRVVYKEIVTGKEAVLMIGKGLQPGLYQYRVSGIEVVSGKFIKL